MKNETLLLRQVHPSFIKDSEITSQVFRPTPKDEDMLSMYDGDMISAEDAYINYNETPNCSSVAVVAVSNEECLSQGIPVVEDRVPFIEHISLNFSAMQRNEIEKKAKLLKALAKNRGYLYNKENQ